VTVKATSPLFDCWDAMYGALVERARPSHPVTGIEPDVAFSGHIETTAELIIVPGTQPDQIPSQVWTTNTSKVEEFTLLVRMWTVVPGMSDVETRDRLKVLQRFVESTFRNQTTGLPQGIDLTHVWSYTTQTISAAIGPYGTEGFGGWCDVGVHFKCRI
jgi:hypothetical protein